MVSATPDANSPYKFLEPYGMADRRFFFGREREKNILLSDVIVSRLVVLFAKSGTGKTSLINAGVRPVLEERGYTTFFVRVNRDPAASALDELRTHQKLESLPNGSFASLLEGVVSLLDQPVVLFFDQFEEFFLYLLTGDAEMTVERKRGLEFISEIGKIYRNPESRVHVVFSMREEFFVEMDAFHEEIPAIFHKDSNLRLRGFTADQARDAIVRPAAELDVTVAPRLVRSLLDDLVEDGRVGPTELQIVCDTLWRERTNGRIDVETYRGLSTRRGQSNIAAQILVRRLEEELAQLETAEELMLVERLLPLLQSPEKTKYVRDLTLLRDELGVSNEVLRSLLDRLARARFVRTYPWGNVELVELSHDYLVGRLDELRARVSTIWPRRVLRREMANYSELGMFRTPIDELEDVLERATDEWEAREAERRRRRRSVPVPSSPGELVLDELEAGFLFRFALQRGLHMQEMFQLARERGVLVWEALREVVEGDDLVGALYAVELLAQLPDDDAIRLLERACARDVLAGRTIEVLAGIESDHAVRFLARALHDVRLAAQARQALLTLARSRKAPAVAESAARALVKLLTSALQDDEQAPGATEDLGWLEDEAAVDLLAGVLRKPELLSRAEDGLARLTRSPKQTVAARAMAVLAEHLGRRLQDESISVAVSAVDRLHRLDAVAAVELLAQALEREDLASAIEAALVRLVRSHDPQVAARAQETLGKLMQSRAAAAPAPSPEVPLGAGTHREPFRERVPPPLGTAGPRQQPPREHWTPARTVVAERLEGHVEVVARAVLDGRVVPFVGAGVNLTGRPQSAAWSPGEYLPSATELAAYLAEHGATRRSDDLARVSQYFALEQGKDELYSRLRKIFDVDYASTPVHRFLASLPARLRAGDAHHRGLVLVTTNYDDALERAFERLDEEFDLLTYVAEGDQRGRFLHRAPGDREGRVIASPHEYTDVSPETRPTILKLHGGINRDQRDSYVITEDDYLTFLARADISNLIPVALAVVLRRSHFLFLGYGVRDWTLRSVFARLWGEQRRGYRSWAVQSGIDEIDLRLWEERGVDVLDVDLEEYVSILAERLDLLSVESGRERARTS